MTTQPTEQPEAEEVSPTPEPALDNTTRGRVAVRGARDTSAVMFVAFCLERLIALKDGGRSSPEEVRLVKGYATFPANVPEDAWKTPAVSLADADMDSDEGQDWDPVFDEGSYDAATDTALVAQERTGTFAVDLWATDPVEREALKAAFLAMFRLAMKDGEQSGWQVFLRMRPGDLPPRMAQHAHGYVVRFVVEQAPKDVEDAFAAEVGEWRAQAMVSWQAQELTVGEIARIDQVVQSAELVDPGTFAAEEAVRDGTDQDE